MTAPNAGGVNLGTATAHVDISTAGAQQAAVSMRGVAGQVQGSFNGINSAARQAQTSIGGLETAFKGLAGAMGISLGIAGAVQIGRMAIDLAETSAQVDRTRASFEALATIADQSGKKMLASMRIASRGMISDAALVQSANRAMLLGVADSAEQLGQMLEASAALGQAMGLSAEQAFNDMVTGLGRLSPMILDNLGIANEGAKTFEIYAASIGRTADSLTNAEKKQILLNKIMAAAKPLIEANANAAGDSAKNFGQAAASWKNASDALGRLFSSDLAIGAGYLAKALDTVTDSLGKLKTAADAIGGIVPLIQAIMNPAANVPAFTKLMASLVFPAAPAVAPPPARTGITAAAAMAFTPEQIAAWRDYQDQIAEIDRDAGEASVDAARQYGQQRADTIRSYELTIAREAEDFARNRLRQQQQLERQIERVRSDATEQQAEWQFDLQERIGDIQARGNERRADLERDYQRNRERAERDHRDRLLNAAARLDAVALLQEQRTFAKQNQEQAEAHDERLDKEQRNLQRQIDEAQKAHDRRLDAQRKANERRIQDLRANLAEQQRIEDEDRAVRLQRMAADHQRQLQQMDIAHGERMAQMNRQLAERLEREKVAYERSLKEQGIYHAERERLEAEANRIALAGLTQFVGGISQLARAMGPLAEGVTRGPDLSFPSLRDPTSLSQRLLPTGPAVSTSSRNLMVQMQAGAIVVNAAPGQSAIDIAQVVDARLYAFFREMADERR
jgi:hypothetical protein